MAVTTLCLGFSLQSATGFAGNACHEIYSGVENLQTSKVNLTPDVQEAINRSILNLAELRLSLDLAQASGRSSMALTALIADYKKKEQALVEYLEKYNIMTKAELVEKIKQEIAQRQDPQQIERKQDELTREEEARRKEQQERQILEKVIDGNHAIFHRIEPGSFMMGEVGNQVPVTLTKAFDMMATVTTQSIWKKVAELVNQIPRSHLGPTRKINLDPSYFKGDTLPVESVSYDDIQHWIKGLNRLSQAGQPALAGLIPGHKMGDVYRLPTEAEWEFVIRGRGSFNDAYYFGNDKSQLGDYAWFNKNAEGRTHPVAEKKPLVIDGREFYDMHGNVMEWTKDWHQNELSGGIDPQGADNGTKRVLLGGCWNIAGMALVTGYRKFWSPENRSSEVGFRLVREVR